MCVWGGGYCAKLSSLRMCMHASLCGSHLSARVCVCVLVQSCASWRVLCALIYGPCSRPQVESLLVMLDRSQATCSWLAITAQTPTVRITTGEAKPQAFTRRGLRGKSVRPLGEGGEGVEGHKEVGCSDGDPLWLSCHQPPVGLTVYSPVLILPRIPHEPNFSLTFFLREISTAVSLPQCCWRR